LSESKRPATAYTVCQAMVELIEREQRALLSAQLRRQDGESLANNLLALARSCTILQSELRKTSEDANRAAVALSPQRRVELVLAILRDMSPEHRVVVSMFLDELGGKLLPI
jgi:hypothetical protein